MDLDNFLLNVIKQGASDIHFKVGSPPVLRIDGDLVVAKGAPLKPRDTASLTFNFLNRSSMKNFRSLTEIDTTYSIKGKARFRVNIYRQQERFSIAMRYIPYFIPTIEYLGIPQVAKKFAMEKRGFVLVTGATGTGKTTTLAAIMDHINKNRRSYVITIEDPIEFVHMDNLSVVNQREVGVDTPSFLVALKSAMREDPDVLLIGEMRDAETIETCLRAASTGHLVFSTFHTTDATETISGMINYFEPHQQPRIRNQLAANLIGVISQRLIKKRKGKGPGRVLAAEVMVVTSTIKSCVLDPGKSNQIPKFIAQGKTEYDMQTFDQAIMKLHKDGMISKEEALANSTSPADFQRALEFGEDL
ncbi:PilT/PilU family type 4a pilus ATPase [bacterium]|nr:PilT/PilU family type 4a pilus ATPase [bacterium]